MNDFYQETENIKSEINSNDVIRYFMKIKSKIDDGDISAVSMYLKMKDIEKSFNSCMDSVKENALSVVSENKVVTQDGYELTEKQGGRLWNFKNINRWNDLKTEMEKVEFEAKQNFNNLNRLKTSVDEETGELINEETGEIVILPEVKYKASGIQLKKLKND